MIGHPRYEEVTTSTKLTPEVEFGSIAGAGGIGQVSTRKTVRDHWWKFEGHRKTSNKTKKTGAYKVVQWQITENELQAQALHSNTFHTAFSFGHDGQPFFMRVEVSGKLKRKTSDWGHRFERAVKSLKFPLSLQSSRSTTILIYFNRLDMFEKPLDEIEKRLDKDMQLDNMVGVPTVQEHTTAGGQPPEPAQEISTGPRVPATRGASPRGVRR